MLCGNRNCCAGGASGSVRTEIHVARLVAIRTPHPLEGERPGVEHDDASIAVAVSDVQLVAHRIDDEVGRPSHIRGVIASLAHARLAELAQELALLGESQNLMILGAVAGEPHDVLLIDEDTVLGLRPVVPLTRTSPRVHQLARLIELENRRRGNAAVGLRRFVVGSREALVGEQAAGSLHDEEMILSIDGHATDRTDRPVLGQRFRERRVVLEDRNLRTLRLRDDVVARGRPECDKTHDDCPNDSRPIHTPPLCLVAHGRRSAAGHSSQFRLSSSYPFTGRRLLNTK